VLAVESFVDESRYRGVCYRACGFEAVGLTAGYKRSSRDFYHEHGEPKQLYLRELRPGARALMRRGRWPADLAEQEEKVAGPCPFRAGEIESLLERFRQLVDTRRGHGLRHRQAFVLTCASVAVLMGAGGYKAIEDTCKKFTQRQLRAMGCQPDRHGWYRPPSDSTFFRVLGKLDAEQFDRIVGRWLLEQEFSAVAHLAIDGKTLRGSGRTDGKPLQLLSVVTHRLRLTLAQVPIEEKSNEIPAMPELVRRLPKFDGVLITTDEIAMYATSLALGERTDEQMMEAIRGHWAAIENGVHYRRDVSFGEDDCRIAQRKAAHAMATLRSLAIGLYELQRERGRMEADGCKSWCRQMTVATALTMLRK
jgi:predicted transposase YbfD/YdcC